VGSWITQDGTQRILQKANEQTIETETIEIETIETIETIEIWQPLQTKEECGLQESQTLLQLQTALTLTFRTTEETFGMCEKVVPWRGR